MKKLDADLGKIYHKDGFYYLEKIFSELGELIEEDPIIKARAKRHGFKVIKSNWEMQQNPHYYIETIINDYDTNGLDPLRYVFKLKLKYMK
jgi:hypothetical protein|tara:strand:- start:144 stop:416 length:273 start_codon:yes stop_codon:yes gene_type:complete